MKRYNGLNSCKVNHEAIGICKLDGMRFTDPNCTHATPEQIERCKEIDARMDAEDCFGHVRIVEIEAEVKNDDAWLDTGTIRTPNNLNHARYPEQVAIVYGQSSLPHDAELDGTGNDPDLVTELRGGF